MKFLREVYIKYWDKLVAALIIILGYFQISFFLKTLKFDAIYFHYPWRYIIVDHLNDGQLPLWNFFNHLGLPIHADPQSGAWYPIVWLFSLFGKYSLYLFNIEYMLHIFIAAIGFYKLLQSLKLKSDTCLVYSIIYVFTGFFVGHAAHFSWIISISWIPWIINYFYILLKNPNLKISLLLSFFMYMLISGGYPSFTIVLIYVLIIWSFFDFVKNKESFFLKLKYLAFSSALTILMSSVFLYSVISYLNEFTRGEGISYEYASDFAINFKTLLSLLYPFSTVSVNSNEIYNLFGTDISMSNFFFGIIPLIFAIVGIIKSKVSLKLFFIGLVFLVLCFGESFYFHKFLFTYAPGFNLFRFPAFFRYFFLFIMLVISAKSFNNTNNYKYLNRATIVMFFIALLIGIFSIFKNNLDFYTFSNLYETVISLNVDSRILINSIIQIPILILFLLLISKTTKHKSKFISGLMLIEIIIAFQIYAPYTLYPYKSKMKQSQEVINDEPNKFLLESNTSIYRNSLKKEYPYDKSLNVYNYEVSYLGNFSYLLKSTASFLKTENANVFLDKPLLRFSERLNDENDIKTKNISLVSFNHNSIKVRVSNEEIGYLKLIQNYYDGWEVYINGESSQCLIYLDTFMAVKLDKGINIVEFKYEPKHIKFLFYISLISFITILLLIIILQIKSKNSHH